MPVRGCISSDVTFTDDLVFVGIKPPTPWMFLLLYAGACFFCIYGIINLPEEEIVQGQPLDPIPLIKRVAFIFGAVYFGEKLLNKMETKQTVHLYKKNGSSYASLN